MYTSHYTKRFISPWSDEQLWHLWGRVAFCCTAIGQQHCRVYGDIVHCLHTPGQCPALCGLKDIPAYLCGHRNSANEISVSGMGLGLMLLDVISLWYFDWCEHADTHTPDHLWWQRPHNGVMSPGNWKVWWLLFRFHHPDVCAPYRLVVVCFVKSVSSIAEPEGSP